jgi:cell division protein FtsZ
MTTQNRSIKILGVGSAGKNILARLRECALPGAEFAVADTAALAGAEFFPIDAKVLRDPAAGETAFAAHAVSFKVWCAGAEVVFIVAGLGGKSGSTLAPVAARLAKEAGALVLGFASMPFECEGNRRAKTATESLESFRLAGDGVVCLPNEKILRLVGESVGLREVFSISDNLLADGIFGVWRLLSCPGLIEIHFDDLRDLIRAGHAENVFATAEAAGPNRVREVVEKLIAHPLLDSGRALSTAQSALVSIVGGPGLSMAEVNRVMEQINRQCEGAQVLMGAAVDETFKDRLAVTIIAARREGAVATEVSPVTMGLHDQMLNPRETFRPASRFVPPPPALSAEKMEEIATKRSGAGGRARKNSSKMKQEQLPLEIISKGRFDKSEPTVRNGEDLDQPTFIRRGMVLN